MQFEHTGVVKTIDRLIITCARQRQKIHEKI